MDTTDRFHLLFVGDKSDLGTLRRLFAPSLRGMSLRSLMEIAEKLVSHPVQASYL